MTKTVRIDARPVFEEVAKRMGYVLEDVRECDSPQGCKEFATPHRWHWTIRNPAAGGRAA